MYDTLYVPCISRIAHSIGQTRKVSLNNAVIHVHRTSFSVLQILSVCPYGQADFIFGKVARKPRKQKKITVDDCRHQPLPFKSSFTARGSATQLTKNSVAHKSLFCKQKIDGLGFYTLFSVFTLLQRRHLLCLKPGKHSNILH